MATPPRTNVATGCKYCRQELRGIIFRVFLTPPSQGKESVDKSNETAAQKKGRNETKGRQKANVNNVHVAWTSQTAATCIHQKASRSKGQTKTPVKQSRPGCKPSRERESPRQPQRVHAPRCVKSGVKIRQAKRLCYSETEHTLNRLRVCVTPPSDTHHTIYMATTLGDILLH